MRLGEITGLRWADVTLPLHRIRLPRTKNGEPREVPLSEAAERALVEWTRRKDWGRRESTFVFPSPPGKRPEGQEGAEERPLGNLSASFARIAKRAKVQGVRFHDLRHAFCTRMVEAGTDLITLKAITGHKTLAMLARYSHPSDALKLAAVRKAEGSRQSHNTETDTAKASAL